MYTYEKPDNLVDLWEDSVKKYGKRKLFGVTKKDRSGVDWVTYDEVAKRVDNLRGGLAQLGLEKGDTVGIISNNRPEWMFCAFASYGRGARYVPMYEKELYEIWKYIIKDSGIKILFVSTEDVYNKVKGFVDEISSLEHIFVIESDAENSLAALEKKGEENPIESVHPSPYDDAGIIYTSGTTGDPKGVLLTHGNFSYTAVGGIDYYVLIDKNSTSLSILPWAHSYGQTGELYGFIYAGASIGFMESVDTLAEDFNLVKPTILVAVPRIFNKIYDGIWAKMNDEGGAKLKLFRAAVETAEKKAG